MTVHISSSIEPQYGFHRIITTSVASQNPDWLSLYENSQCSLHLYYKFPVLVFVDSYELANYQSSYSFQHHGDANLELPAVAMGPNGTSLLLTLDSVKPQLEVQVPLHLRYGKISHSDTKTHRTAEMAWPDVFLACSSSVSKPFLALYESLPEEFASNFKGHSLYVPLPRFDASTSHFAVVTAPVGQYADVAVVQSGTAFTILTMFLYLAYVSYRTYRRLEKPLKRE
ncbi:PIG-X [Rhodocollybia butyracea]|uniref:Protein PBN1 n=1 Tax=Rhodocollybia butyracea TaxID=206335 RepID=A0A9P5UCT0_9AGAR|nr:PIG-X [Rhodocollybia butyracea]